MATRNASRDLVATFAANLRDARIAARMTQHELSVALGRGDGMTVSRWERGEHRPSQENLVALAEVLGRDVSWFYTDHRSEAAA